MRRVYVTLSMTENILLTRFSGVFSSSGSVTVSPWGAKKGTLMALVTKTTAVTELYSVAVKNNGSDRALQCSSEKQQQ